MCLFMKALLLSISHHEMNTSEICANIPILNINDLFKNCLLFGTAPGVHIYYYHWRAYYFLKLKKKNQ